MKNLLPDILKDKVDDLLNTVLNGLDAGVSIIDKDLKIIWANEKLSDVLDLHDPPLNKKCMDIYHCKCPDDGECDVLKSLASGKTQLREIELSTEQGERKYIQNVSMPLKDESGSITHLLKLSLDITEKEEKFHQLSMLQKLAELMHGTLELNRLLHLILTCVTAGTALGFNRARLFFVDKEKEIVYGKMAVGPSSLEEACKIWDELTSKYERLEDLIKASEDNYQDDTPLHMITRLMIFSLKDDKDLIVSCIKNKKPILEKEAFSNPNIDKNFVNMIGANEFVCVPLIVRNEAIGLICADKYYSRKPITDEHVQLLSTFADHAALAIENAGAYKKLGEKIKQLEDARERLIQSERLAMIGNMSAYIAHEIRNPLVTIGGFARSILRNPHDSKDTEKSAEIIIDEVTRLEKFLANIMDFSKTSTPEKTEAPINKLLENTCSLMETYIKNSNIDLIKSFDSSLPDVVIDPSQIRQVFLNLIKNAVESMPNGGHLIIETFAEENNILIKFTDSGKGMSEETVQNVFVPFYTTKHNGTGIGLAVSQKIIDNHEGKIKVKSKLHEGTAISIYLPRKK